MPGPEQFDPVPKRPIPLSKQEVLFQTNAAPELPAAQGPEPTAGFLLPQDTHESIAVKHVPRDRQRWPESDGYPPVAGGASEPDGPEESLEAFQEKVKKDLPYLSDETIQLLYAQREKENQESLARRVWLDFFLWEGMDDQNLEYFSRELPEVMERRQSMSREDFTKWFLENWSTLPKRTGQRPGR